MPGPSTHSDELLAEQIRLGNESAFMVLFEKHHGPLYLHVLRFTGSDDVAKDIVQDTFLRVWLNKEALNPDLCLRAFLFTISKNLVLNYLKKKAREQDLQKQWRQAASAEDTRGEDHFTFQEYEALAMEGIQLLPPKRQAIFRMSRLEGKDHAEISATLGISQNTVRDHLAKATKTLKHFLAFHTDLSLNLSFLVTWYCLQA